MYDMNDYTNKAVSYTHLTTVPMDQREQTDGGLYRRRL